MNKTCSLFLAKTFCKVNAIFKNQALIDTWFELVSELKCLSYGHMPMTCGYRLDPPRGTWSQDVNFSNGIHGKHCLTCLISSISMNTSAADQNMWKSRLWTCGSFLNNSKMKAITIILLKLFCIYWTIFSSCLHVDPIVIWQTRLEHSILCPAKPCHLYVSC